MKIKTGDTVQIMIGRDKGKTGKVKKVFPKDNAVLVEGVNEFKKHRKARMPNEKSEIVTISKPLNIAKVSLIDSKTKKPARAGYKVENGKKVRIAKESGGKL